MKLPASARLCEACNSLSFGAEACPDCGGALVRVGAAGKYRNKPVVLDGLWFASRKEARRWSELVLQKKAGDIFLLGRQKSFDLVVNRVKVGRYVSDFDYLKSGGLVVVEDVKGPATRRLPLYVLKKKLMLACHGITIVEI